MNIQMTKQKQPEAGIQACRIPSKLRLTGGKLTGCCIQPAAAYMKTSQKPFGYIWIHTAWDTRILLRQQPDRNMTGWWQRQAVCCTAAPATAWTGWPAGQTHIRGLWIISTGLAEAAARGVIVLFPELFPDKTAHQTAALSARFLNTIPPAAGKSLSLPSGKMKAGMICIL